LGELSKFVGEEGSLCKRNPLMLDCYQLSEDTAAVLLKTTHLLFDGWSLAIFAAELFGEEEISGNDGFYRTYDYVRERSKRKPGDDALLERAARSNKKSALCH